MARMDYQQNLARSNDLAAHFATLAHAQALNTLRMMLTDAIPRAEAAVLVYSRKGDGWELTLERVIDKGGASLPIAIVETNGTINAPYETTQIGHSLPESGLVAVGRDYVRQVSTNPDRHIYMLTGLNVLDARAYGSIGGYEDIKGLASDLTMEDAEQLLDEMAARHGWIGKLGTRSYALDVFNQEAEASGFVQRKALPDKDWAEVRDYLTEQRFLAESADAIHSGIQEVASEHFAIIRAKNEAILEKRRQAKS